MLCYPFHLDADSSRGLAQCQNGVVLGSVQPVDSQFSAGGPFHHGDVILTPGKHTKWLNNTDKTLGEKNNLLLLLTSMFVACYWILTASDCKGHHSPYPWVIRFLHYYRVQGTVQAHHWQVHDRVLLPGLQRPTGNIRQISQISAEFLSSAAVMTQRY